MFRLHLEVHHFGYTIWELQCYFNGIHKYYNVIQRNTQASQINSKEKPKYYNVILGNIDGTLILFALPNIDLSLRPRSMPP